MELRNDKWSKMIEYKYYMNYKLIWGLGLDKKYYALVRSSYDGHQGSLTTILNDLKEKLLFDSKDDAREYLRGEEWGDSIEYKILSIFI